MPRNVHPWYFCVVFSAFLAVLSPAAAAVRDRGVDPANLGKGDWIYSVRDATNRLGGHISTVTNLTSLMQFYRSQDVRYIVVKAATSDRLYNGCQSGPQFNTDLVRAAQTNGIYIFGYNRSYGSNILGEIAISDFVFNQGADGFVWDAEVEWETRAANTWITNGPVQAWALCSAVRSNWPTKFLAHAPFPIISLHASFPYKEFGYWSDAVMPQVYHFGSVGITNSASAAMNWTDVNWHKWQNDVRALPPATINGMTVYWTNAIKPLAPMRDVYGATGALLCNGVAGVFADKDVMEFMDFLAADRHAATVGGYNGASYWRTDLHSPGQWQHIKSSTIGHFAGVVNNIVLDDWRATYAGAWTPVRTFAATPTAATYYGATGTDTNSFGTNYFAKGSGTGSAYAEFTASVTVPGLYDIYQWHPHRGDASTNVPFVITHANGSTTNFVNQKTNSGNWSFVGRHAFSAGTPARIRITDGFTDASSVAIVDGLKLVFVPPNSPPNSPASLAATTLGATQIALAWSDHATNETGYIVARGGAAGGPFTNIAMLPANAAAFTNNALPSGSTFHYVVRATNILGASLNSNPANATTATNSGQIIALFVRPDQRVQLTAAGENVAYAVESSTNLLQWTKATNVLNTNGSFSYVGEPVTNSPQKFFRLKLDAQ